MIPRHSVPFGMKRIITALASRGSSVTASDVEKRYEQALGVPEVILLPSVRTGIAMSIQAVKRPGLTVVGPAYTCHSVHEAMALSGVQMRLVDAAPGGFLMAPDAVGVTSESYVLVLSEVYGIAYQHDVMDAIIPNKCRLRLFDLAMSIPSRKRMQQLGGTDVALFSFGWGKPMYTGWGGIACFKDVELAGKVREIRDRLLMTESGWPAFRNGVVTVFESMFNKRCVYGFSHQPFFYRWCKKFCSSMKMSQILAVAGGETCFASFSKDDVLPPQWTRPMSAMNRVLALGNLQDAARHAEIRRRQAELYCRRLVETGVVRGPSIDMLPQSHFPILVAPQLRNELCDYLRWRGIDTSTLFPMCAGLSRDYYPHAAQTADQVIALPLGLDISLDEVKMISIKVVEGLRELKEAHWI